MIERLFAFAQAWAELGFLGLCALALVFALGTLSFMPRFTFYSIGGAVFGLAAVPAAIIGSSIGAAAAFLLARTWLHGAFQRQVERRPKWRSVFAAIDAEGWRIVVLTRFVSPLPGGMINYLFGLTRIAFVPYIVATACGLLPPVAMVDRQMRMTHHIHAPDIAEPENFIEANTASTAACWAGKCFW